MSTETIEKPADTTTGDEVTHYAHPTIRESTWCGISRPNRKPVRMNSPATCIVCEDLFNSLDWWSIQTIIDPITGRPRA